MKLIWVAVMLLVVSAQSAAEGMSAESNYILRCAGCHRMDGMGAAAAGVPEFPDSIGHIAATEKGRLYLLHVPGVISSSLTDQEIADVLNLILDRWGEGAASYFREDEVQTLRAKPVANVVEYRRALVEELRQQGIRLAEYPW